MGKWGKKVDKKGVNMSNRDKPWITSGRCWSNEWNEDHLGKLLYLQCSVMRKSMLSAKWKYSLVSCH